MPDVILQVYPALGDEEEMRKRRPIGRDNEAYQRMLDGDLKEAPTPLFEGHDPRWALQTLGTEWGRQKLGSNLWTHHLLSRLSSLDADRIVVDDVRMDNEAEALRYSEWAHQTRIWEVHALGQQARRHPHMHASEYGINELLVDASIQHDFTMAEMQRVVDLKLAELGIERKGPWHG